MYEIETVLISMNEGDEIISVTESVIAVKEVNGSVRVYRCFTDEETGDLEIADRVVSITPARIGFRKNSSESGLCVWSKGAEDIFGEETQCHRDENLPF